MVIILNDNNMSIAPNVGGTARQLQKMRIRPGYVVFKRWFKSITSKIPFLYRLLSNIKERLKTRVLLGNMFSAMGFNYLGPVDGHDINALETALHLAREDNEPVIIHVLTKKGKGYKYAEEHPELYHGVGPFDPVSGKLAEPSPSFSEAFGRYLCEFAARDKRISAITAAMASGTGLDRFAVEFPERFVDAGIAEGHAVAMAAGMAKQGAIPVFSVYSSFMQRGYDMLIHDVSLQSLHAVFAIDRAGIVGNDGETHHGLFDVNYMFSVPGMKIYCPASFAELRDMLEKAIFEDKGPVTIRYPRGGEGAYRLSNPENETVIREGKDITIACYGTMVNECVEAARMLEEQGIDAEIIKLGIIKPAVFDKLRLSVEKTGRFIISEDVCAAGCMGQRIMAELTESGVNVKQAELLNLGEGIVCHGKPSELMREYGLDAVGIYKNSLKLCRH